VVLQKRVEIITSTETNEFLVLQNMKTDFYSTLVGITRNNKRPGKEQALKDGCYWIKVLMTNKSFWHPKMI
jgi:hypothetical protein